MSKEPKDSPAAPPPAAPPPAAPPPAAPPPAAPPPLALKARGFGIPKLPPDIQSALDRARDESKSRAPSYPPDKAALADKVAQWKDQRRTKCRHRQCHYPLNFVRVQGQMVEVHPEEGPAFLALCSWDPSHMNPDGGGFQFITKEAVEDAEKEGRGPRR